MLPKSCPLLIYPIRTKADGRRAFLFQRQAEQQPDVGHEDNDETLQFSPANGGVLSHLTNLN